ncbi:MAG: DEAD/DEAH box helicase [Sandaracinaceae bacterium]|nr:DEAD/DEAH box helicase [Sandaracinaceae bacterium]
MTAPPSFASLGLGASLVRATAELGWEAPTPVQARVVPAALAGGDVWAQAPTGSGKTASFVLPLLERLAAGPARSTRDVSALILAPTRELAAQIGEVVEALSRSLERRLVTRVVFGGVSINPQMMALRGGADVVIATPGRLLDLSSKNAVALGRVSTLILDEADRLLDQGFADELDAILALVPSRRQTLLFSATLPSGVEGLARAALRDPTRVDVRPVAEDAPDIRQRAIAVDAPRRTQLLRHLLESEPSPSVLVFVATTYATEHVARKLRGLGVPAAALHGKRSQGARTQALADFQRGKVRVLVATDVAARGLDVSGLSMVVNYDLPRAAADYLHRIGRTGRAGATGVAVSFVTAEARAHFRLIQRRHGLDLPREVVPGFEPTQDEVVVTSTDGTGGVKGRRKSKKDKLREAAARERE